MSRTHIRPSGLSLVNLIISILQWEKPRCPERVFPFLETRRFSSSCTFCLFLPTDCSLSGGFWHAVWRGAKSCKTPGSKKRKKHLSHIHLFLLVCLMHSLKDVETDEIIYLLSIPSLHSSISFSYIQWERYQQLRVGKQLEVELFVAEDLPMLSTVSFELPEWEQI